MADKSRIEWCDATWNPVRGCSRISLGCGGPNGAGGCYAEKFAARFSDPGQPFHGFAKRTKHGGQWTGKMALIENNLTLPLRWRKPRRIFVNSMSDLFHENLSDYAIDQVFAVMALCPQHTFQVLTKRASRMNAWFAGNEDTGDAFTRILSGAPRMMENGDNWFSYLNDRGWPLPNVWLGVSVEDQAAAELRVPDLLATPAAVRFLSCEPLLGEVNLTWIGHEGDGVIDALRGENWIENWHDDKGLRRERVVVNRCAKIDQVICGGESGPRKRPTDLAWHRSLRDQCKEAGVAFFEKQIDKVQSIPDDLMIREWL